MITHRGIRQARRAVLIDQPGQNPSRCVSLLLRGVQIRTQHVVNRGLERLQPRRHPQRRLPRRRHRRLQRLAHRTAMHTMLVCQRPDRQPLDPMIPADRRELLHLRPHPPAHPSSPTIRAIQIAGNHRQVEPIHVVTTSAACREDGARSGRHNSTPAATQGSHFKPPPGANSGCHSQDAVELYRVTVRCNGCPDRCRSRYRARLSVGLAQGRWCRDPQARPHGGAARSGRNT